MLSVRPEESWWKSFSATIATLVSKPKGVRLPPHIQEVVAIGTEMIEARTFAGKITDRDVALAAYRQGTARVRAAIAPDRLLVFDVAESWAPLCHFLDVPTPDFPFPRANTTEEFWQLVQGGPH